MTHIVLLNLGGPGSLEEIKPFLYNLFTDPDIISLPGGRPARSLLARLIVYFREPKVQKIYNLIGGKSPLLDYTRAQAMALEQQLSTEMDCTVHVAMRYTQPDTESVLKKIPAHDDVIYVPLYPQYSQTTTGSSFNEIERVKKKLGKSFRKEIFIPHYHDLPSYISAWASVIKSRLNSMDDQLLPETTLLFSAHGIPQKIIDKGDPYEKQVKRTVELVVKALQWKGGVSLSYQSKAGPSKWLEPSTEDELKRLGANGCRHVVVIPIAFVSEHSETLYELDILLKDEALKAGIQDYQRVAAFNDNPEFIHALKEVVLEYVKKQ